MAILIQKQSGTVNIIDTDRPTGEQIALSISLDSTASHFPRSGDDFDYIQTYDSRGNTIYKVVLDGVLQYQDEGGSPATWGGTLDELNNKLNNEYFVQASGGGGGGSVVVSNNTDPSTATAQQDQTDLLNDLSDDTKRRVTGKVVELANDTGGNWVGFPLELAEIIIFVNGAGTSYPLNDVESTNSKDLANQLNIVQSVLSFDYIEGSDEIVFNGVSSSSVEVTGITLEDNNSGTLEYSGFPDSVDMATGSVQQLVLLAQKNEQQIKQLIDSNPVIDKTISLSYTGNLEYNLTANADIDGKLIPTGSFGDIVSIQDLDAGNVNYRFDGGTPSANYPTMNGNRAFDRLVNVDFNTFRIKAGAGGAAYTIIINLYK